MRHKILADDSRMSERTNVRVMTNLSPIFHSLKICVLRMCLDTLQFADVFRTCAPCVRCIWQRRVMCVICALYVCVCVWLGYTVRVCGFCLAWLSCCIYQLKDTWITGNNGFSYLSAICTDTNQFYRVSLYHTPI